jgi:hypothetical protein
MVTLKNTLFGRIADREAALDLAKWAGDGLLIAAVAVAAFAIFGFPRLTFVAALFAISGYFTRSKMSRAAAVFGVVLSAFSFYLFSLLLPDSRAGLLFGLVIWIGVRGIEATFKLHGRFSVHISSQDT